MPTNIDRRPVARSARAVAVAATLVMAGCGGSSPSSPVDLRNTVLEIGPNGGPAVELNDATKAELSQRFASGKAVLRVTLLQPDLETPAGASPSGVSARVFTMSGEQSVTFSADPGSPHVWDSPPGDFGEDDMKGELIVSLGGETITRPFAFR